MKRYKTCRVRCVSCEDVLEHTNQTKDSNVARMLICSCGKIGLDPSATLYRIVKFTPDAEFEDFSEGWK